MQLIGKILIFTAKSSAQQFSKATEHNCNCSELACITFVISSPGYQFVENHSSNILKYFQVLSRAALAAHDSVPSTPVTNLNIDYCRTLECSVPGPQVRVRPRQLDVGTIHCFPATSRAHHPAQCRVASPVSSQAQSHIYMEVDPLYSSFNPGHHQMMCEPQYLEAGEGGCHTNSGLVSSTSSQTSSGYSTAPSDRNSGAGHHNLYECEEYGDMFHHGHQCQQSSQDIAKDSNRVFNISQTCDTFKPSTNRNSQRIKKPELVMNNILLQHSKREVL